MTCSICIETCAIKLATRVICFRTGAWVMVLVKVFPIFALQI